MQPLPSATECPPGLPSSEAKALFDWHIDPNLLPPRRARREPARIPGLAGLQACGLLLPPGTGTTSLATSLGNLTNRSEESWYLGQKHSVTFRQVRLTERPCAVMTVRDPYERLRSGFRYDKAHMHHVDYATLTSSYQSRRTLRELLHAFRNSSAPGHATVRRMYNHSVIHPACNSEADRCVRKRSLEKPMNPFLWSQSAYLLDDPGVPVPSIHFLCTNNYVASWQDLLVDFEIQSNVPAAHALSGRAPAASDTLPYDDADARFVRNCLYPWDTYLNQRLCGSFV